MPDLGYIHITPERLAALCIVDAASEIEATYSEPARWFFAISKLHRALNCALVAALRGTAGIGAYAQKDRKRWIEWFDASRTADIDPPGAGRVEEFTALLTRALDPAEPEMGGSPLLLSEVQKTDLYRLNKFRGDLEHVKPGHWSLEVGGLPRIAGAVASAMHHLFEFNGIGLHLDEGETQAAREAVEQILVTASRFPSTPPNA